MIYNDYLISMFYPPILPTNNYNPPTIYSILESIVNYGKDDKTKIKDLAKVGRTEIFDFDYPLTNNIKKEDFESMILNKFLMRRIGFETLTAFKIQLNVKLNEIMPMYNKMFDAIENWDILNDGEITEKSGTDNRTVDTSNTLTNKSITNNTEISDRRNSELPQSQLSDLRNGSYVTDYNYDTNTSNGSDNSSSEGISNSNDKNTYNEVIKRSPADKISIYKEFQENLKSVYTLIFKDLDCLFFQLL